MKVGSCVVFAVSQSFQVGGMMLVDLYVEPNYVSFGRVWLYEEEAGVVP